MKKIAQNLLSIVAIVAFGLILVMPSVSSAASEKSIITKISELGGISSEEANKQFNLVFQAVKEELVAGNEVVVKKFGKFQVQNRSERDGRNPKTGATIRIPAKRYVHFKSYDSLKDDMNVGVGKATAIAVVESETEN